MSPAATHRIAPLAPFAHAPLLVLITACMMVQTLSTDLYLASLPSLAAAFTAPPAAVQLTLSLFVLGFGTAQLVVGPLSDRFGRRTVLLAGLALYVAASILCALAPSMPVLIAARFVQSLGACSAVVVARAVVRDAYAPEHAAQVLARASTWLSIAPLAGPILGSYLQIAFGWRAAFVALAIFSAVLLALCAMRLPETNVQRDPRATDPRGLFANWRTVLGSRAFWAYALPSAFSYSTIFAFISGSSFVLIRVLNVPTAWFGYCFAFGVSGYMLGTIVCQRLLARFTPARVFAFGTLGSALAGISFLAAVLAGVAHWSLVLVAMFCTMGAHGINFPIAQASAVSPFPRQAGTAAGLFGALTMGVAFAVGTAVGATHDGSLLPLASIVAAAGIVVFASARAMALAPAKGMP
jgi:DHA1 family bicyclomycin/chloramphenicol resistance-like MFS transporter